jgi:hypothetical protein
VDNLLQAAFEFSSEFDLIDGTTLVGSVRAHFEVNLNDSFCMVLFGSEPALGRPEQTR